MGFMQFLQANFPQGGRIPQSQALTLYRDYLSAQYDAQSTGGSSGGLTPWQLYTLGRHGKLDARQSQQRQEDLNWRRTTHQYRVNQDTQGISARRRHWISIGSVPMRRSLLENIAAVGTIGVMSTTRIGTTCNRSKMSATRSVGACHPLR
jgi:hypothetical protein